MENRMLKPTILSISLLTIMAAAAISPALGKISQAFPDVDMTTIKLILTLPCLIVIPISLLSGWLTSRMSKKLIVLIGLVVYFIAGASGGFARNITDLLISRGILGIGVGLIMPISTTLIIDFFDGQARNKMMGLSSTISSLGGILFQTTSGWLAVMSWRYSFGVYSLSLIAVLLTLLFLPEPPRKQEQKKSKIKLGSGVFVLSILTVLMMIAFFAAQTNLALFIASERQMFTSDKPLFSSREELLRNIERGTISETMRESFKNSGISLSPEAFIQIDESRTKWQVIDKKKRYIVEKEPDKLVIYVERLGKPALAGYALSTLTFSSATASFMLSMILGSLGVFSAPFSILLMGIGFGLLTQATALWVVFVAVIFIGLGAGIMMPLVMLRVPKIVAPNARTLTMAIVGSSIYFGQFISPFVLKAVATISGHDTFRFRFAFIAVGLAVATLVGLVLVGHSYKKQRKKAIPPQN